MLEVFSAAGFLCCKLRQSTYMRIVYTNAIKSAVGVTNCLCSVCCIVCGLFQVVIEVLKMMFI